MPGSAKSSFAQSIIFDIWNAENVENIQNVLSVLTVVLNAFNFLNCCRKDRTFCNQYKFGRWLYEMYNYTHNKEDFKKWMSVKMTFISFKCIFDLFVAHSITKLAGVFFDLQLKFNFTIENAKSWLWIDSKSCITALNDFESLSLGTKSVRNARRGLNSWNSLNT